MKLLLRPARAALVVLLASCALPAQISLPLQTTGQVETSGKRPGGLSRWQVTLLLSDRDGRHGMYQVEMTALGLEEK
jgi:hypothetical protein